MTDEQIYQILRKHMLDYESKNARAPYGWFTAILDGQKEILAEAMRLDSIGFVKYCIDNYKITLDDQWHMHLDPNSYTEYLKTKQ